MLILAIDTTGFSASIALVKNGKDVLFGKIGSGFVPNKNWQDFPYLLPERHLKFLLNNFKNVFKAAGINWKDIDAIAVSANSGIYNCILVGLTMAETLAHCHKKLLIKVDHILAHAYSPWLERNPENFQFPILAFSASGSHSGFFLLASKKKCEAVYDAVPEGDKKGVKAFIGIGKVFYEIGKKMGIITSADLSVDKLIKFASSGNSRRFDFVKYYSGPLLNLDFSDFAKSISQFIEKEKKKLSCLPASFIRDVAASFQESITEILAGKIIQLAKDKRAKEIHIAGGISENKYLKRKLKEKISAQGGSASGEKRKKPSFVLRYPVKKEYRLDNAAMIGALAYYQKKYKIKFINFEPKITK